MEKEKWLGRSEPEKLSSQKSNEERVQKVVYSVVSNVREGQGLREGYWIWQLAVLMTLKV